MSDEDRMDALLRQLAAEEYNRPPEIVPREQMWEAIRQGSGKREAGSGETAGTGNGEQGTVLPFHRRVPRWVYYAVAAALLLALGIQLGRLLGPSPTQQLAPRTTQPDSLGPTRVSPESVSVGNPRRDLATDSRSDNGGKGPQLIVDDGGVVSTVFMEVAFSLDAEVLVEIACDTEIDAARDGLGGVLPSALDQISLGGQITKSGEDVPA